MCVWIKCIYKPIYDFMKHVKFGNYLSMYKKLLHLQAKVKYRLFQNLHKVPTILYRFWYQVPRNVFVKLWSNKTLVYWLCDTVASTAKFIQQLMRSSISNSTDRDSQGNGCGIFSSTILQFANGWGKISINAVGIRTRYIPNASQKRYRSANPHRHSLK
jgi:hypothetical protein